jgi:hypothetical protein
MTPLVALLNLMTHLTYSFSAFASSLLSQTQESENHEPLPLVVSVLSDIIQSHLLPSKVSSDALSDVDRKSLAGETVGLLESLCWNTSELLQERSRSVSFPKFHLT